MPGRLLRAGVTPSGSTKATETPASRGTTDSVTCVPSATGVVVNPVTDAGGVPSEGPVVRKTNGKANRPHGTPEAVTDPEAGAHPAGAPGPRSRPGSTEATSHVAVGASPSWSARTWRRRGCSAV